MLSLYKKNINVCNQVFSDDPIGISKLGTFEYQQISAYLDRATLRYLFDQIISSIQIYALDTSWNTRPK